MGATFPALCSILIRSRSGVDRHLGRIYGLNTLGAVVGTFLAGFVLIRTIGVFGSTLAAAWANLWVAVVALEYALKFGPVTDVPVAQKVTPAHAREPVARQVILLAALAPAVQRTATSPAMTMAPIDSPIRIRMRHISAAGGQS